MAVVVVVDDAIGLDGVFDDEEEEEEACVVGEGVERDLLGPAAEADEAKNGGDSVAVDGPAIGAGEDDAADEADEGADGAIDDNSFASGADLLGASLLLLSRCLSAPCTGSCGEGPLLCLLDILIG